MSLLDTVHHWLDERGTAHAMIGAMALAAHGLARSSLDVDLLATDLSLLEPDAWDDFSGGSVDARVGGVFDPLAGVIRIAQPAEIPVDIVLFGPHGWQAEALHRASGSPVPIVALEDLVLLKLFAGGPRDRADIHGLLDLHPHLQDRLSAHLDSLPPDRRALWGRILDERSG